MSGSLADENDAFEELESDDEDKDEEVDESERVRTRPVLRDGRRRLHTCS